MVKPLGMHQIFIDIRCLAGYGVVDFSSLCLYLINNQFGLNQMVAMLLISGDEGFRELSAVDPEGDSLLQEAINKVISNR
jgi:hypothetical protein